jgi:hypothetical protein
MFDDWGYGSTGRRVWIIIRTALGLSVCSFILGALANCTNCSDDVQGFFAVTTVFSLIGGLIIGIIYWIAAAVQKAGEEREKICMEEDERYVKEEKARKEAELKQRQQYASEINRKYDDAIRQCRDHEKKYEGEVLRHDYKAVALQEKLWDEINGILVPLQEFDDIVSELKFEEGK